MLFCTNDSKFLIKPISENKEFNVLSDKIVKILNLLQKKQLAFFDNNTQNILNNAMFENITTPGANNLYYQNLISNNIEESEEKKGNCDFCDKEHGICKKKQNDQNVQHNFDCSCKKGFICIEGCTSDFHYDYDTKKTLHVCKPIITSKIYLLTNNNKLLDLHFIFGREHTKYSNLCEDLLTNNYNECNSESFKDHFIESGFGRSLQKKKIYYQVDNTYMVRSRIFFGDIFSQALRVIESSISSQLPENIEERVIDIDAGCDNLNIRYENFQASSKFKLIYIVILVILLGAVYFFVIKKKKKL